MLAIIGGTGLYQLSGLENLETIDGDTPFGAPSAPVTKATLHGQDLLFLPRHGSKHQNLPHEINYRANIYALKAAGARQVISISAVGSLREDLKPGDFVMPDQYFDFVKGPREKTFFGEGLVAHISSARPTCPNLTSWVSQHAQALNIPLHTQKTYACVDGPRLGTRAESFFLRGAGCDIVGMTNVPEVFLAREAQLAYATIGIVTDYDCWMDDPTHDVTVADVIKRYGGSLAHIQSLIDHLFHQEIPASDAGYRCALKDAVLTPIEAIPEHKKELFNVLNA